MGWRGEILNPKSNEKNRDKIVKFARIRTCQAEEAMRFFQFLHRMQMEDVFQETVIVHFGACTACELEARSGGGYIVSILWEFSVLSEWFETSDAKIEWFA